LQRYLGKNYKDYLRLKKNLEEFKNTSAPLDKEEGKAGEHMPPQ
jgi:hypothetical protein